MIDLEQYHLIHAVEREYPPLASSLFSIGQTDRARFKNILQTEEAFRIYRVHANRYQISQDDQDILKRQIERLYAAVPNYLEDVAARCYREGDRFLHWAKQLQEEDLSDVSEAALLGKMEVFCELYKNVSVFLQYVVYIDDFLNDQLATVKEQVSADELLALVSAEKENYDYLQQKEIFEIAAQASDVDEWGSDQELLNRIDQYVEHFCWMATRGGSRNPAWTRQDAIERIKNLVSGRVKAQFSQLVQDRRFMQKEAQRVMDAYRFDDQQRRLVALIKEYLYLRTYRTDVLGYAPFLARPLMQELGKRWGLTYWDVMAMTSDEIFGLKEKPDAEELRKRLKNFEMIAINGEIHFCKSIPAPSRKIEGVIEVKGKIGCGGKIVGPVSVIQTSDELHKVKTGDILVAVMTFPNYIPAMEKAAAFVTDEGGILCHAAIVAREMKKPCVIGTKFATKVFKDGEMVEVDADNGIVQKINL